MASSCLVPGELLTGFFNITGIQFSCKSYLKSNSNEKQKLVSTEPNTEGKFKSDAMYGFNFRFKPQLEDKANNSHNSTTRN